MSLLIFVSQFLISSLWAASPAAEFLVSCRHDQVCAQKLAEWNNEVLMPSEEVKKLVCKSKNQILEAADLMQEVPEFKKTVSEYSFFKDLGNKFYVRPEIMASCLMAEHMLLYYFSDIGIDNVLEEENLAKDIAVSAIEMIASKSMKKISVGPVQMNLGTAQFLYPLLYPDSSSSEDASMNLVVSHLLGPESFNYMAAYLGHIVLTYSAFANPQNQGRPEMDIRDNPGAQCSLYNLGSAKSRAKKRWKDGGAPGNNFYGHYAEMVYPLAQELIHGGGCE